MSVPIITYYAKVIDNITGEQILPYTDNVRNNTWYYGKCHSWGGESQYIVEFDIWNNEPAFNAGINYSICPDANNIRLEVWPDEEMKQSNEGLFSLYKPFMYAKDVTVNYNNEFKPMLYDTHPQLLYGNVEPNENKLSGKGDHCVLQTKLILPPNNVIKKGRSKFVLALLYDYE